ncbi:hypothetical protein Leryth_019829 [Lithospermum erythrorhizon]|nr:hypothetical protein Leryth_019829 [Lithospermum erythrorhizon]
MLASFPSIKISVKLVKSSKVKTMKPSWSAMRFVDKASMTRLLSPVYPINKLFPFTQLPHGSPVLGLCQLARTVKGDVHNLLGDKNVFEDARRIVEMAKRASMRQQVLHTNFLTPPILKETKLVLEKLADIRTIAQGGYPQAELCRLSVGHPEVLTTDPDIIAALSITGNFGFQPCSHGDFLGAILGTGISREKLGDIILQGENGAHVLVVPELVDFLTSSLDKVGNVSVSCKRIPLLALEYEPPRTMAFKSVEASLRVDAIASAGFKISRSKMAGLISSGDVRVNWITIFKSNTMIKTGDIISVSQMGRLKAFLDFRLEK